MLMKPPVSKRRGGDRSEGFLVMRPASHDYTLQNQPRKATNRPIVLGQSERKK